MRCAAEDRQALEQLCRYITRPALANERVQTNAAGQVVLKLKTPWRDGTTHINYRARRNRNDDWRGRTPPAAESSVYWALAVGTTA